MMTTPEPHRYGDVAPARLYNNCTICIEFIQFIQLLRMDCTIFVQLSPLIQSHEVYFMIRF